MTIKEYVGNNVYNFIFIGINIPKTTRNKWKDIYYTESTTQKSNWLQYGSRYGRETVQVVHLTTILARTGLFSVSGLLVVCQEEYDIDKVVVTDRHSALWGLVTWEGNRRFVPRNIDNWAIRYIKEVFRRHVHNSIKRKIHTKQLHFLLWNKLKKHVLLIFFFNEKGFLFEEIVFLGRVFAFLFG